MRNNVNNETYFDYNFLLGKQIIDDIRSQLDRFRSVEMGLTKERAAHLDAQNQMLTTLFIRHVNACCYIFNGGCIINFPIYRRDD